MTGEAKWKSPSGKDFATKWPGLEKRGYVQVPKCLITCTSELNLTAPEARVLFILMEKIWSSGEVSWEKVDTIAEKAGMKNSSVRAITRKLQLKGFIAKEQRYNMSNNYSVEPAILKLKNHLASCRGAARLSAPHSQETSGQTLQVSSDYIDPLLTRTINTEPFSNSLFSINEEKDELDIDPFDDDENDDDDLDETGCKHDITYHISMQTSGTWWKYHICTKECGYIFHYIISEEQALAELDG